MNEFDNWNEIKKKVDANSDVLNKFPKEGEVWMCVVGKNIGYEQNGSGERFSRPVLVIRKFNNHMFWVVPLSTKQKAFDFYYNYTDPEHQNVSAIIAQLKLISIKRFNRKIYELNSNQVSEIKSRLKLLI